MINDSPLGKPFNLATDARQMETAKHSERYFDDLLSSISGQFTKLRVIVNACNEVRLRRSDWNAILSGIS